MKPKPLYRSMTFWSGIFVILSIVWFWWDSTERSHFLSAGHWRLHHWASGVALLHEEGYRSGWGHHPSPYVPMMIGHHGPYTPERTARESNLVSTMRLARPGFHRFDLKGSIHGRMKKLFDPETKDDPALRHLSIDAYFRVARSGMARGNARGWVLFVPYWVVLAGFTAVWGAALGWRARRPRGAKEAIVIS